MYSSYSVTTVAVSVVFPTLATIAVACRFRARQIKQSYLGIDDYTILAALIIAVGAGIMCIYGAVDGGIGDNPLTETHEEAVIFFKLLFAIIILHLGSLTIIKLSILLLYKRIFTTRRFKMVANITMVFVVAWFIAFFIGVFFSARPISNFWNNREVGFAYDFPAFLLALAVLDLAVDLFTLCLPLPVIRKLNMSTKRKIQLVGIFWLGLFCVVSAAVRLYYVWDFTSIPSAADPAFPRIVNNNFIWALIEPCSSIIAACLPTLAPLMSSWRGPESIVNSVRSVFSLHSLTGSDHRNSPNGTAARGGGVSLVGKEAGLAGTGYDPATTPEAKRAWQRLTESNNHSTTTSSEPRTGHEMDDLELGHGVKVEKDFVMTTEQ